MKVNDAITSDSRKRIEAVLKSASHPLSAQEVSDLSGISISITRTHLGNAVQHGRAHNLNPGKRCSALYVWGKPSAEQAVAGHRLRYLQATYTGEKSVALRDGAMDAYLLPSRRGDELVEHRLPISLAGA